MISSNKRSCCDDVEAKKIAKRPCSEPANRFTSEMQALRNDRALYFSVIPGDIAWLLQVWGKFGKAALSLDRPPDVCVYGLPNEMRGFSSFDLSLYGTYLLNAEWSGSSGLNSYVLIAFRVGRESTPLWKTSVLKRYQECGCAIDEECVAYVYYLAENSIEEYRMGVATRVIVHTLLPRVVLFQLGFMPRANGSRYGERAYVYDPNCETIFWIYGDEDLLERSYDTQDSVRDIRKSVSSTCRATSAYHLGKNDLAAMCLDCDSNVVLFKGAFDNCTPRTIEFCIYDKDFNFKMLCRVYKIAKRSRLLSARISRQGQIILLTDAQKCTNALHCDVYCSKKPRGVTWSVV